MWQIVIDGVFGIFTSENIGHIAIFKNFSGKMETDATNKVELIEFRLCLPEGWFFLDTNFL